MATRKKCITPNCRRSLKITDAGLRMLHEESVKMGRRAGVLCPECVTAAFEASDGYKVEIPLGEVMAESLRDKPHWYVAFAPVVNGNS